MLISSDVEQTLIEAGFEVCGVASSEAEALDLAESLRPEMAIVDISLSPGDGRVVAKALCSRYSTAVLFATGQCDEVAGMRRTGAIACLPKPYQSNWVPAALRAVGRMADGMDAGPMPDLMFSLAIA